MENKIEQIEIFIAYSREDTAYLNKLRQHLAPLKRSKIARIWYDGEIIAGKDCNNEIKKYLKQADIILLLVSASALASEAFCSEMDEALTRHKENTVIVIPIILRDCLWKETELEPLQPLPKNAKAVDSWKNESEAYTSIGHGILDIISSAKKKKAKRIENEKAIKIQKALEKARTELRRQNDIKTYIAQAKVAFTEENYEKCLFLAEKVNFLDKNNLDAEKLTIYAENILAIKHKNFEKVKIEQQKKYELEEHLKSAIHSFEQKQHSDCIFFADKVLELDKNNIEAEQLKVSSENHLKLQQQVFDKLMLEKQLKNSIKWYVEQIAIDFKQKRYEECIANVKKTFKLIISSEYIQAMKERIKLLSLTEKIVNIFSFLAIIYIIYFMLIDVFFNN